MAKHLTHLPRCRIYVSVDQPSLVQIMACHLFGAKTLFKPIGPLGTNFSEILIKMQNFSFMKMHLKISSVKRRRFCPGEMSRSLIYWCLAYGKIDIIKICSLCKTLRTTIYLRIIYILIQCSPDISRSNLSK